MIKNIFRTLLFTILVSYPLVSFGYDYGSNPLADDGKHDFTVWFKHSEMTESGFEKGLTDFRISDWNQLWNYTNKDFNVDGTNLNAYEVFANQCPRISNTSIQLEKSKLTQEDKTLNISVHYNYKYWNGYAEWFAGEQKPMWGYFVTKFGEGLIFDQNDQFEWHRQYYTHAQFSVKYEIYINNKLVYVPTEKFTLNPDTVSYQAYNSVKFGYFGRISLTEQKNATKRHDRSVAFTRNDNPLYIYQPINDAITRDLKIPLTGDVLNVVKQNENKAVSVCVVITISVEKVNQKGLFWDAHGTTHRCIEYNIPETTYQTFARTARICANNIGTVATVTYVEPVKVDDVYREHITTNELLTPYDTKLNSYLVYVGDSSQIELNYPYIGNTNAKTNFTAFRCRVGENGKWKNPLFWEEDFLPESSSNEYYYCKKASGAKCLVYTDPYNFKVDSTRTSFDLSSKYKKAFLKYWEGRFDAYNLYYPVGMSSVICEQIMRKAKSLYKCYPCTTFCSGKNNAYYSYVVQQQDVLRPRNLMMHLSYKRYPYEVNDLDHKAIEFYTDSFVNRTKTYNLLDLYINQPAFLKSVYYNSREALHPLKAGDVFSICGHKVNTDYTEFNKEAFETFGLLPGGDLHYAEYMHYITNRNYYKNTSTYLRHIVTPRLDFTVCPEVAFDKLTEEEKKTQYVQVAPDSTDRLTYRNLIGLKTKHVHFDHETRDYFVESFFTPEDYDVEYIWEYKTDLSNEKERWQEINLNDNATQSFVIEYKSLGYLQSFYDEEDVVIDANKFHNYISKTWEIEYVSTFYFRQKAVVKRFGSKTKSSVFSYRYKNESGKDEEIYHPIVYSSDYVTFVRMPDMTKDNIQLLTDTIVPVCGNIKKLEEDKKNIVLQFKAGGKITEDILKDALAFTSVKFTRISNEDTTTSYARINSDNQCVEEIFYHNVLPKGADTITYLIQVDGGTANFNYAVKVITYPPFSIKKEHLKFVGGDNFVYSKDSDFIKDVTHVYIKQKKNFHIQIKSDSTNYLYNYHLLSGEKDTLFSEVNGIPTIEVKTDDILKDEPDTFYIYKNEKAGYNYGHDCNSDTITCIVHYYEDRIQNNVIQTDSGKTYYYYNGEASVGKIRGSVPFIKIRYEPSLSGGYGLPTDSGYGLNYRYRFSWLYIESNNQIDDLPPFNEWSTLKITDDAYEFILSNSNVSNEKIAYYTDTVPGIYLPKGRIHFFNKNAYVVRKVESLSEQDDYVFVSYSNIFNITSNAFIDQNAIHHVNSQGEKTDKICKDSTVIFYVKEQSEKVDDHSFYFWYVTMGENEYEVSKYDEYPDSLFTLMKYNTDRSILNALAIKVIDDVNVSVRRRSSEFDGVGTRNSIKDKVKMSYIDIKTITAHPYYGNSSTNYFTIDKTNEANKMPSGTLVYLDPEVSSDTTIMYHWSLQVEDIEFADGMATYKSYGSSKPKPYLYFYNKGANRIELEAENACTCKDVYTGEFYVRETKDASGVKKIAIIDKNEYEQWLNTQDNPLAVYPTVISHRTGKMVYILYSIADLRLYDIKVYDISGKLYFNLHQTDKKMIDLASLPAGVYVLQVDTEKHKLLVID